MPCLPCGAGCHDEPAAAPIRIVSTATQPAATPRADAGQRHNTYFPARLPQPVGMTAMPTACHKQEPLWLSAKPLAPESSPPFARADRHLNRARRKTRPDEHACKYLNINILATCARNVRFWALSPTPAHPALSPLPAAKKACKERSRGYNQSHRAARFKGLGCEDPKYWLWMTSRTS